MKHLPKIWLTDARLLEGPLSEEQSFDARQALMWIIIRLFNQGQFFSLRRVETTLDTVRLLQFLQSKDKELCVVLVGEWPGNSLNFSMTSFGPKRERTYGNGIGANFRLSNQ